MHPTSPTHRKKVFALIPFGIGANAPLHRGERFQYTLASFRTDLALLHNRHAAANTDTSALKLVLDGLLDLPVLCPLHKPAQMDGLDGLLLEDVIPLGLRYLIGGMFCIALVTSSGQNSYSIITCALNYKNATRIKVGVEVGVGVGNRE